jgi:phenylacetate-CoA ligase
MASAFTRIAAPIAAVWTLFHCSRRLQQEQWLPAGDLSTRRRRRVQRLLVRAAAAPYYRAVFREAGLEDPGQAEPHEFEKLPFLDREVIARNGLEAFLTVEGSGLVSVTTSGSTGTPGRFLRSSLEESEFSARWRRVYAAFGCGAFDRQVNVAVAGKPARTGAAALLRAAGLLPRVESLAWSTPPEQVLERIRALRPPILTGYAGAIEALAEHVLATGARIKPPTAVFCTAMEVTDRCLELAGQAFRAPAVDVYVTNELGVIAWSCPKHRDLLHVNDDVLIVEVVDPEGTPLPPGAEGELVVTSLGLTSMPLIRYRTGDLAAQVPGRCKCGRGLGLLTRVRGRTAHAIRRPDGAVITTPAVTSLVGRARAYEWVRQFQVREEPDLRLRVLLETRRPPTEAQLDILTRTLQSGLGPHFLVACEMVDRIPMAPNGKLQFLVPLTSSQ